MIWVIVIWEFIFNNQAIFQSSCYEIQNIFSFLTINVYAWILEDLVNLCRSPVQIQDSILGKILYKLPFCTYYVEKNMSIGLPYLLTCTPNAFRCVCLYVCVLARTIVNNHRVDIDKREML